MALLAPILARHAGEPVRAEAPLAVLMAPSGLMLDELVGRSPFLLAVLLGRADVDAALRAAERILARVGQAAAASPAPIAVSGGVATGQPGEETAAVVRRADEALDEAKDAGKQGAAVAPLRPAA